MRKATKELTRELYGEWYEYVPLGKHVVAAPGVCGGRPTFKYTRLEVSVILDLLAAGWSAQKFCAIILTAAFLPRRSRKPSIWLNKTCAITSANSEAFFKHYSKTEFTR